MHEDFLNQELQPGDYIVFAQKEMLCKGIVHHCTAEFVSYRGVDWPSNGRVSKGFVVKITEEQMYSSIHEEANVKRWKELQAECCKNVNASSNKPSDKKVSI